MVYMIANLMGIRSTMSGPVSKGLCRLGEAGWGDSNAAVSFHR